MHTFTDVNGRQWKIELNISEMRRLRNRARQVEGFEEFDVLDYAVLLTKINDPIFSSDLLFLICEEQATEEGVDSEAFGRALKGRVLFDAIGAFVAEYIDFFPDPTVAEKIATVYQKTREAEATLADAICETTERLLKEALEDAGAKLGALS